LIKNDVAEVKVNKGWVKVDAQGTDRKEVMNNEQVIAGSCVPRMT
jgi:hypothetical protein